MATGYQPMPQLGGANMHFGNVANAPLQGGMPQSPLAQALTSKLSGPQGGLGYGSMSPLGPGVPRPQIMPQVPQGSPYSGSLGLGTPNMGLQQSAGMPQPAQPPAQNLNNQGPNRLGQGMPMNRLTRNF